LLVDNEPDVLLTEKIVLEQYGFKVDSFTDPLLALENFRANVYDMIILDIKMPEMNGLVI
jgi:DNA-binding response OmpR family regulator